MGKELCEEMLLAKFHRFIEIGNKQQTVYNESQITTGGVSVNQIKSNQIRMSHAYINWTLFTHLHSPMQKWCKFGIFSKKE